MPYEVYLYNVPKVSDDGKESIPVPDSRREEFKDSDAGRKCLTENKDEFDRLVLMETNDDGQKMVERYRDGEFEKAEDVVRR